MSKEKRIYSVTEQDAIFDGEPDFMPQGAVMNLLNYNSAGGTAEDYEEVICCPDDYGMENPKRYRVTMVIHVQEI